MAKQKKVAFGIAEDGLSLKLAFLTRDGQQVCLQALEQVKLEQSLYQHPTEKPAELESISESWNGDLGASNELNLDNLSVDGVSAFRSQPYDKLFQTYSLESGALAINAFEEQIIKIPLVDPDISHRQKLKLIKESIPLSEFKGGQYQHSVVTINEQAELWIHHNNNRLLEILQQAQKNQKSTYFFQLADANESALANLYISTMPEDSKERNMVLYLGKDYRRALIFEGSKWINSFPISITQQPDIDIVYSKLSLALDEAHISDPDNLFVCGDNCFTDSIEYLRAQLPNTGVEMWHLKNLYLDSDAATVYDGDMIARFMLPIALAWKALTMDNPATIKSNFLPSYLIESQKYFKIAWHGYLLLALVFFSALYLSFTVNQLRFSIRQQTALNEQLTREYTVKKQEAALMLAMQKTIERQQAIIETIKTLLVDKNPWTEIITRLNNSFQTRPTSWIRNLRKDGEGFKVTGVTTHRPNIVYFAGLFPNGQIINAKHRKIRSFTVWDFEITYEYPEVDWYKMMEADAENLRKYQERKNKQKLIEDVSAPTRERKAALTNQKTTTETRSQPPRVIVRSSAIDIPYPAKNLIENTNDPMVKSYTDIVAAFNAKNDWLMTDLGVKFINNYPNSPLISYVRWYLAHRSWSKKQYDDASLWLEPISRTRDAVYPFTMMLISVIARDTGDVKRAESIWRAVINDYPQHQAARTARAFLNE